MAFNGKYYIKVGDYPIPLEMMAYKSYTFSRNVQDSDSYHDGDGLLHRNVLPYIVYKADFETPYMTERQVRTLVDNIRANVINALENNVNLTFYDPWSNTYKTGVFYLPGTIDFTPYNKNIYEPLRIAFIGYGIKGV